MAEELDMTYIARLVRQAQSGDSDAFAQLYVATCQRLYRFSCRYLRDKYLAQDALQQTYIKALQHMNQLHEPTLVVSWLGQINMRVCYRMQHHLRQVPTEDARLQQAVDRTAATDPQNEVVQVDYDRYLMKQILNLPFTESQVLLLRYYHNMKLNDIARMLEISTSTVKRSLSSGIRRLRSPMST